MCVQYHIILTETETGRVVQETKSNNLITKVGKEYILRDLFNLTGATFVAMGIGIDTATATLDDTRLGIEAIADSARKTLTNTSGAALSSSDIQSGTYSVDGGTYYKKLTVQAIYDGSTDPNVDEDITEYAIFSTATLPGTPTGTSGLMFNHYVPGTVTTLTAATTLTVRANIYT